MPSHCSDWLQRFQTNAPDSNKVSHDNSATTNLRKKFRSVDVLLIDDIQFIIGKESSQLEFFNTFETLFQLNKQIVISSDKPPRDMPELDDRYRTRFSSGLLVDIQPPDYETSMAILNNFKEKESIQVDEEVLRFIATNIRSVTISIMYSTVISLALSGLIISFNAFSASSSVIFWCL